MARYECQRCGAECFTTNPPHLCKDLKERYDRQQKALNSVIDIIEEYIGLHIHDYGDAEYADIKAGSAECVDPHCTTKIALRIVKKLSGLSDLGV